TSDGVVYLCFIAVMKNLFINKISNDVNHRYWACRVFISKFTTMWNIVALFTTQMNIGSSEARLKN
ncbi:hypothetical protein O6P43_034501, partial [Quillaja saponaria]